MADPVIQFKRGLLANLPALRAGEPGFTTDSYDLYVGLTSETSTNKFLGSHRYWTKNTTTTASGVNLVEGTDNGTSFITLKAPDSLAGIVTYTMPGTDGSNNQVLATNGSGTLSFINAFASLTVGADSGSDDTVDLLTDTLTFTGGEAIDTTVSDNTITIAAEDATDSNKGVASFDNGDFSVSSGNVTLADSASGAVLTIAGTDAEVNVSRSNGTVTIGLPSAVTVTTSVTTPTVQASAVKANDGTAAITITDSTGAVELAQNLTVGGNLYVNGATTQVNTSQTTIEDQLLDLGMVDGSAPSSDLNKDIGVLFNYYSGSAKKAGVYWDDSTSRVVVSQDVSESSGVLTNNTGGALEVASLYVSGCSGTTVEVIGCDGNTIVITNATIDAGSF